MAAPAVPSEVTPEISIVVPLFNEEDNIALLQQEIAAALSGRDYELVLVDDCSTDATRERIDRQPNVRVLEFERNAGQSAAMYAGMNAARGKYVGLLDGDLQNDPADLVKLLTELERSGVDLMCGYRANRQDTLSKRLTSKVANFVRSRFAGDGVRDTGCTLKVMKRACVEALFPFKGMHRFIPALVKGAGFTLAEMPVHHRARIHGVSKYGFANRAFRATADMFGVKWLLSRRLNYRVKGA
ncbi:MAG: glycosyltransferase family 2 protein [Verrucomicrobia bacterium]|nr:glycosyltransferase family 2 protein [Verrucomicrobiota bacterium]